MREDFGWAGFGHETLGIRQSAEVRSNEEDLVAVAAGVPAEWEIENIFRR